jgi:hypothetical protein
MSVDIRRLTGGPVETPEGVFWHLVPRTPTRGPGRLERRALCGSGPDGTLTAWGPPTTTAVTCPKCAELKRRA